MLIPGYKRGFRIIFIIGAVLAAVAFCLTFWLMPQVALNRADDDKLKVEGRIRVKGEPVDGDAEENGKMAAENTIEQDEKGNGKKEEKGGR